MNHYGVTVSVESSPTSGNVWIYFSISTSQMGIVSIWLYGTFVLLNIILVTKLPVRGLGFWKTLPEKNESQ